MIHHWKMSIISLKTKTPNCGPDKKGKREKESEEE